MNFRAVDISSGLEQKEFLMSQRDFDIIRKLAYEHTGIVLPERKKHMVYSRLSRRLRNLSLSNFEQYCQRLIANEEETPHFINALTTNLTAFFREQHHFDFIEQQLIPQWQNKRQKKLRIWSSACSTGEEAYSIAMTLSQHFPSPEWDLKTLATDLDTNVLNHAIAGRYSNEELGSIPAKHQQRYLNLITSQQAFQFKTSLCSRLFFKQLNLLDDWPMKGPFDAIFCRNVLIYFDKPTKQKIINKFRDLLSDEGYLFIGHSESLNQLSNDFQLVGQTIYTPKSNPLITSHKNVKQGALSL